MGLIKKRPRVRLSAPPVLMPGEQFEATVIVEADRRVPVNAITIEFNGYETLQIGSGDDATTESRNVARMIGELDGRTELDSGVRSYPFTFRLPEDLPPTFAARSTFVEFVHVRYSYDVHIDIPWWPDRRASFAAVVGSAVQPETGANSVITESAPVYGGAHLELSLATDVLVVGQEFTGAIALGNREGVTYRSLEVTLVSECGRVIGRKRASDEHSRSGSRVRLPAGNESITFTRRLPATTVATFESEHWNLRWSLEARAHVAGGPDAVARLPVVMPAHSGKPRPRLAPPIVGRARLELVWREVAGRRGFTWDDGSLRAHSETCELSISRGASEAGPLLIAELRYPSLRLGLSMRSRMLGGREIAGRDAGQTKWFVDRLPEYVDIGVEVSDELLELRYESTGNDPESLHGFITAALRFAREIPRPDQVPVAESNEPRLPAWRELANVLEGELRVADLSVSGRLGGCDVEICHRWPRRGAAKTLLTARPPGALKTPNVGLKWPSGGRGVTLRELADRLELESPLALDPTPLLPKLRALAKLARERQNE